MTLVSNGFGNPTIQHRIFNKIISFSLQIWCCIVYLEEYYLRPTSSSKWTRIFQPQNWLVCTFRSSFLLFSPWSCHTSLPHLLRRTRSFPLLTSFPASSSPSYNFADRCFLFSHVNSPFLEELQEEEETNPPPPLPNLQLL